MCVKHNKTADSEEERQNHHWFFRCYIHNNDAALFIPVIFHCTECIFHCTVCLSWCRLTPVEAERYTTSSAYAARGIPRSPRSIIRNYRPTHLSVMGNNIEGATLHAVRPDTVNAHNHSIDVDHSFRQSLHTIIPTVFSRAVHQKGLRKCCHCNCGPICDEVFGQNPAL